MKIRSLFGTLVLVGTGLAALVYYQTMVKAVVPTDLATDTFLEVPQGASYEQVMDSLMAYSVTPNRFLFDQLADQMNFRKDPMRAGRFKLPAGGNMVDLIRELRVSRQKTANVVLTYEREPINVAAKAARFLAPDSLAFVTLFQDEAYLDSLGYTPETFQSLFIPNTYELYWNTTPREFVARMVKEHQKFWDAEDRLAKAEVLKMTPTEVYTLASIVEKESLEASERPRIAGLYLNRLKTGTLLQADPTVVFGIRQFDLGRVLNIHLEQDTPYNTYMHPGLPIGPIAMASPGSIDAVLDAEEHDYIFMCSKGDGTGFHNFAVTSAGHARNRNVYAKNLRERGIWK